MDFVAFATHSVRRAMVGQVRAVFNDAARGEAPVQPSDDALFARDSVLWRVHGDVTTMMVGGVAALLLQMLHPAVLAGVWDHSKFRHDMLGRLRGTARFIAQSSYASRAEAEAAIARVRTIHQHIRGTLPDGTPYRADDPRLLAWVHVTEAVSFLDAWIRYAEPGMSRADQDRYFAEFAQVAEALGADPVPHSRTEAMALIAEMRGELRYDDRTREVARLLLEQPAPNLATKPFQAMTFAAAIDLLPGWARQMHHLSTPPLAAPAVRLGTRGVAETLRWAFR
ncbi:oxygenase MpaB family protein [Sphingomonas sp.]|uniref:oxygenase MpaB family protein n=1 Tax=Sphingomonas sp. TaxID=28214 RepID=UPI0028ABB665|nr:oxygenase MpaB family protein [Sphingomonas sp.]